MPRRKRFQHRKKNEKEKRMKSETSNNSPLQLRSLPEDSTVEVCSLQQLSTALTLPSREWINQSPEGLDYAKFLKQAVAVLNRYVSFIPLQFLLIWHGFCLCMTTKLIYQNAVL